DRSGSFICALQVGSGVWSLESGVGSRTRRFGEGRGGGFVGAGMVGNVVEDYGFDLKMMVQVVTLGLGEPAMDAVACLLEGFASDGASVQRLGDRFDLMGRFDDRVIIR